MKKRSEAKIRFAAMPARMMGDAQLSALDMRVLMAIAAHDQLGGNGTGCFASHSTLAALVDCHLKSLSRSLSALAQAGYLEAKPNPLNRKTRIYSVIYSQADSAYMMSVKAKKGSRVVTYGGEIGNEAATENTAIGNRTTPNQAAKGNHSEEKAFLDQGDAESNIFCEAVNKSSKADQIHSGEPALPTERTLSDAEILKRIELAVKEGSPTEMTLKMFMTQVYAILDRAEGSSMEYGWSERLLGEIQYRLDDASQEAF